MMFLTPTRVLTVLVLLVSSAYAAISQSSGGSIDLEKMMSGQRSNSNLSQLLTGEQLPTDDVVDPATYRIGPGDVLTYQSTALDFSEKPCIVTPENTIVIERYGIISCVGHTLATLRDSVQNMVKRRGGTAELSLALRRPRVVYVTISGDHPNPGTYPVPASMRVSTLLSIARQQPQLLTRGQQLQPTDPRASSGAAGGMSMGMRQVARTGSVTMSPYAQRNIMVRHRDGASRVDIVAARLPNNGYMDPHVREGDEIIVPFDSPSAATISISGAVTQNAVLSWKAGDKLSLLLAAAGGPSSDADLSSVYLIQPGEPTNTTVAVDSMLRLVGPDVELRPGTGVIVERLAFTGATSSRIGVVDVAGEVRQPGGIAIVPGQTRLTEVLTRAGGVTEQAALSLAYVIRAENGQYASRDFREDAMRRFLYSNLTLEDTLRYLMDQQYRIPYVSCDFAKAFADSASSDNIVLQHGDMVVVPVRPDRIYVYGQVLRPGYVAYSQSKPLEWYVERAGGFAAGAKQARARIVRGRSKTWVKDDDDVVVEPGDEVYVPRAPDVPIGTELQNYAVIVGIVSSITALIGLFYTMFRK